MVTLPEIEAELARNDTADGISSVAAFRELIWALDIPPNFIGWLDDALGVTLELLPIAKSFDQDNKSVWENWESTILEVQTILQTYPLDTFSKPKLKTTSYLSSWITPIKLRAPSGILPSKVVWLIGRRIRYAEEVIGNANEFNLFTDYQEKTLANILRKCSTLKWTHLAEAHSRIPNWPCDSALGWKKSVRGEAALIPASLGGYPSHVDFIRTLDKILKRVSPSSAPLPRSPTKRELITKMAAILRSITFRKSSPNHSTIEQHPGGLPTEADPDIVILSRPSYTPAESRPSSRLAFNYFREPVSSVESDAAALAPDSYYVEPQKDTPADEPPPLQALESLDVRYSNYRSSMDNQRLPWAWDRLNHFEIAALRGAIIQTSNQYSTSDPQAQGAFITWLMMLTGQCIEQILQFSLSEARSPYGCLMRGPTYRRQIPTPPKAYKPSADEKAQLKAHSKYIDVLLTPPFPPLISEMGLSNDKVVPIAKSPTIGAFLKLNEAEAEKSVRVFLEGHRTRKLRLLPGKIRSILSIEVMRVSNDPIAMHLLTAIPSDMPPSGVYYTAYRTEVLSEIYQAALSRIFGGDS